MDQWVEEVGDKGVGCSDAGCEWTGQVEGPAQMGKGAQGEACGLGRQGVRSSAVLPLDLVLALGDRVYNQTVTVWFACTEYSEGEMQGHGS